MSRFYHIYNISTTDLVKISNFQIMSHVTKKIFDLESWNYTGMLISMCSCTPGYFCADMHTHTHAQEKKIMRV
jgi:hypothetical protein